LTAGGLIALLIRAYGVTAMGKKVKDVLLLRVPIMGESVLQRTFFSFFHAVSMMLGAGVPLLHALGIAKQTIANTLLHDAVTYMERDVTSGSSLSQSMSQLADPLFGPDIIAMVRVGEESGSLDTMLERIAQIYQSRMYRTLTLMTTFLQPMLMIVLGLLVCVLMFAVYMPIFRLSQGVG
jgi:type IV pilus assembly protein PilC